MAAVTCPAAHLSIVRLSCAHGTGPGSTNFGVAFVVDCDEAPFGLPEYASCVLTEPHQSQLGCTGMLPVLTELVPMLKAHKAAWLTHSALVAPPLYKTAAKYAYAHTLLQPGPCSEALLACFSPFGSMWQHDIAWQRTECLPGGAAAGLAALQDGTVTPAKLSAWLRALIAATAMPPPRVTAPAAVKHHFPATLAACWRAVEQLAYQVPAHWLASALAPLLDPKQQRALQVPNIQQEGLKPACAELGTWPAAAASTQQWDLGCIAAEMDVLAALFAPRLPAGVLAQPLADAAATGRGGPPVLVEVPLGPLSAAQMLMMQHTAPAHRFGVVLAPPGEAAARTRAAAAEHGWQGELPSTQAAWRQQLQLLDAMADSMQVLGIVAEPMRRGWQKAVRFDDLPFERRAPSQGGTQAQLISCATLAHADSSQEASAGRASSAGAQPYCAMPQVGGNGASAEQDHVTRFWLCEERLCSLQAAGWQAFAVVTDLWMGLTLEGVPLSTGRVVKRVTACSTGAS